MSDVEKTHEEGGPGEPKQFNIIVNGRQRVVTEKELSFAQLIPLAFENPPVGPNVVFTVTYSRGEEHKPKGSLVEGDTVKIKEGMVFNVTATNKS